MAIGNRYSSNFFILFRGNSMSDYAAYFTGSAYTSFIAAIGNQTGKRKPDYAAYFIISFKVRICNPYIGNGCYMCPTKQTHIITCCIQIKPADGMTLSVKSTFKIIVF